MRLILTSMMSGVIGAALLAMFWRPLLATEVPTIVGEFGQACQVKIVSPRPTSSQRCFRDEVMTGRWDDMIYCATIQVACEPK